MRTTAILVLVLCVSLACAAEGAAPDLKAQGRELELKLKTMREQAVKDDAELGKLKAEADDARKRLETATEAKLRDNADYKALKAQLDELRAKHKEGDKKKDGK